MLSAMIKAKARLSLQKRTFLKKPEKETIPPHIPLASPDFPVFITKIKNGYISVNSHHILDNSLVKNISKKWGPNSKDTNPLNYMKI